MLSAGGPPVASMLPHVATNLDEMWNQTWELEKPNVTGMLEGSDYTNLGDQLAKIFHLVKFKPWFKL